uniref:CCR4-NOT transcription complex subunit 10 isoform X3 n=1 Tax=Rhizophora mucronata TaxID=61149 RepID=A0A2P2L4Z6_RHIMU
MDLRDSSSSQPLQAAARELSASAASSADDDAILSVTTALAKDAAYHFQSRRFSECLDVLNQLKPNKEDDPKASVCVHTYAFALVCIRCVDTYYAFACASPTN